jgi:monofunctional chorismate mutase
MDKLLNSRNKIDEIDTQIIELFEKRMGIVKDVIDYKIKNNIPILDNSREVLMLEENLNKIQNPEYKKYYKDVLAGFLKASKDMQQDILNKK